MPLQELYANQKTGGFFSIFLAVKPHKRYNTENEDY